MGTPVTEIYDAFFVKMLEDEWSGWEDSAVSQDLMGLLRGALVRFKFPRASLALIDTQEGTYFEDKLSIIEIEILATYMKCEWLSRSILTWENVKPEYIERDFSKASLLDKLNDTLAEERIEARRLEALYYRSINGKPFDFGKLVGGN